MADQILNPRHATLFYKDICVLAKLYYLFNIYVFRKGTTKIAVRLDLLIGLIKRNRRI